MAVDDKSRSVARTEIISQDVVRLAMFSLMKHPTYQGAFCCIHPGPFMITFQEHWIDYEYSGEDSPAAVVQASKELVQTCLGNLDLSQLCFSWESECTRSSRPSRPTRPTNTTQVSWDNPGSQGWNTNTTGGGNTETNQARAENSKEYPMAERIYEERMRRFLYITNGVEIARDRRQDTKNYT